MDGEADEQKLETAADAEIVWLHRDGGPVGQRQGRARRFLSVFGRARHQVGWVTAQWRNAHVAHEAQAFARNGTNQLLVAAAVAHSLSCGVDAAR
ncbi:MAG TPA: hypothetical protein VFO74_10175 [Pseudolabrys sp.]|nr:hypothetical protein [Pseudolabrys sp.]